MRLISHRSVAVCIGGAAAAMALCGAILNYGAAKVMSPGEAATTLAWAAALSEAIKLSWLAGFRVCLRRREMIGAATLLGVGALLHGYTMIAVLGSSAVGRDEVQSERQGKIDARARAEAAVAGAKSRVASYEGVRSEAAVQQDINRLLETPDTNGCKRPYGQPAKTACEQIGELKIELVGARKADQAREDLAKAEADLKKTPDAPQSIDPQSSAIAAWLPLSAEKIGRLLPLLPSMLLEFTPMGGMMLASILWGAGGEHNANDERGSSPAPFNNKHPASKPRRMTRDEALEALRTMALSTTSDGKLIIGSGNSLAKKLGVHPSTFRGWAKHWQEKGLVEIARRETKREAVAKAAKEGLGPPRERRDLSFETRTS
jgi:transposase-like protein